MQSAVSEYLNPVSRLVGEYLTLEEMRDQGWKIPRRLLRERLAIEYPTVEAMYKSGFTIPRSILKRMLTIDPATIKRGENIDLTPEEIDSIAADILLYGVPDEYTTDPDLYEGLPNWLQVIILDPIISEMSPDMITKFFSSRMARPGKPATFMGMNKDREDMMAEVAGLLYKHKILEKGRRLWDIIFERAAAAKLFGVIYGLMDEGYRPSFMKLIRLVDDPYLFNKALDGFGSIQAVPLEDFTHMMELLQGRGIKTPKLVKLFAERRNELIDQSNSIIKMYEKQNAMIKGDIARLESREPLSAGNQYTIKELKRKLKRSEKFILDQWTKVHNLVVYWSEPR